MTTATDVYSGFVARLGPWAASRNLPVKWPDVSLAPPNSGFWLEVRWIPNDTINYGLSNDGPSILQGHAQVTVMGRPGAGALSALQLSDQIMALYAKGTLLHGMVRVYRSPWLSSVDETPSQTAKHVSIAWRGSA